MRYKLFFKSVEPLVLPIGYHQQLQGLIYHMFALGNKEYASELHNDGYDENKHFRLFSFGKIYSKQTKVIDGTFGKQICFDHTFHVSIGCVDTKADQVLLKTLNKQKYFMLGNQEIELIKYQVYLYDGAKEITIKMDSPITVHKTIVDENNKQKTIYFQPNQQAFIDALIQNTKEKFQSYYGKVMPELIIQPIEIKLKDKYVTKYKNHMITAWHGTYIIKGHPAVLRLLYYGGLGSKTSQGFGLFDITRKGESLW